MPTICPYWRLNTLSGGKRLFADDKVLTAFKMTESMVAPNGVIVVNYERASELEGGEVTA
jgi:hypothetical protein